MSGSYGYNDFEAILESSDFGWFMEEYGLMILGVLGIIILVVLLFSLVTYILSSVGLYTIAKRRGIDNPWLAWIPVANYWTMGCISDQYQYVVNGKVRNKRKVLVFLAAAPTVIGIISNLVSTVTAVASLGAGEEMFAAGLVGSTIFSLVSAGLSFAMLIVYYITLNDIYNSCSAQNGTVLLVLSIIFPVLVSFFFFALRKKDGGMPPRRDQVVNPVYQPAPAFAPPAAPTNVPPTPDEQRQEFL